VPQARHWVYAAAIAIYILNAWGAFVTVGGYGAGCPDWPTCYGKLIPPFYYATLIEYTHRMISVVTGLILLTSVVQVWRMKPRPRGPARLMLLAIILLPIQIGIGGEVVNTVVNGGSPLVATAHFAFATGIFALVTIAAAFMYLESRGAQMSKPPTVS
jgi:heme a synthase